MPVPGPVDLARAVRDLADGAVALGRAATHAVDPVPRLEEAFGRVEMLLLRPVLTGAESAVGLVAVVIARAGGLGGTRRPGDWPGRQLGQ